MRRTLTGVALWIGIGGVPAGVAHAQDYPSQQIRIVVSASPGGPNDTIARLASQTLSKLGQPAIVENRAGAGGALAAREVAAAKPDGHTLMVGNTSTLAVIPTMTANAGYDPERSFAPVAKFWESYQLLVVHPSQPWQSVKELVDYARANPGKLTYAHTGPGGAPHLSSALFMARMGINLVPVPYRSGGELATAVLSQAVDVSIGDIAAMLPLVRDNKLRALAVTSRARTPLAPDLPTMIEAGVPDFEMTTFFGIVAPAGTPEPIVRTINAALNEGLRSPEARAMIARLGAIANPGSPADFAAFIASKRQWAAAAKAAGVKLD